MCRLFAKAQGGDFTGDKCLISSIKQVAKYKEFFFKFLKELPKNEVSGEKRIQ